MNTELLSVKNTLEKLKPELMKRYPISSMGLFGSIVRDDFGKDSDIDIIVDFNGKIGIEFVDLADELEENLHRKVDLVSRGGIQDRYFNFIKSEIVYV